MTWFSIDVMLDFWETAPVVDYADRCLITLDEIELWT